MQGASYEELQAVELREPSWGLLLSPTDGNNLRIQMTPSLDKPTTSSHAHPQSLLYFSCNYLQLKQLLKTDYWLEKAWGEVGGSIMMTINPIKAGVQEPRQLKHVP